MQLTLDFDKQGDAMLRALVIFACVCFSIPAQAKLGETVPQLIKRFGNSYTAESDAIGKTYKFRSERLSVDVLVANGVSVSETYLLNHPLTRSGEPPNDIVQAVLRTNVPSTRRWVEIAAAPFRADYAQQSSDHEYIALLRYTGPQPEDSVWTMTVGLANVVGSVSTARPPSPVTIPLVTQTPTPTASVTTAVAVASATPTPHLGFDFSEQLVAVAKNWADAISDPVRKVTQAKPWEEHIGEGLLFFLAMVTVSTLLSAPIAFQQKGDFGNKVRPAFNAVFGLIMSALVALVWHFPFVWLGGRANFAGSYLAYCYGYSPYMPLIAFAGLILAAGLPRELRKLATNPATVQQAFALAQNHPDTSKGSIALGCGATFLAIGWATFVTFRDLGVVHDLRGSRLAGAVLLSLLISAPVGVVLQRIGTLFVPAPEDSTPAQTPPV